MQALLRNTSLSAVRVKMNLIFFSWVILDLIGRNLEFKG